MGTKRPKWDCTPARYSSGSIGFLEGCCKHGWREIRHSSLKAIGSIPIATFLNHHSPATPKGLFAPLLTRWGFFLEQRMPIQLIVALLIAASGFGAGWKVQQWRFDAQEAERAKRELVAIQSAAAADLRRQTQLASAQDGAVRRERQLRADAAGSRDALVGLHAAADAALRAAEASHAACTVSAASLSAVLETVATERRELSEKADRHVSDIQTLIDAWPKP